MLSISPFIPKLIALLSLTAQLTTAYDPCGPLIPVENVTVSTCTAPLTQVPLPAIYGVQCFGNFNPPFLPPNGTDCKDLIPQICAVMSEYVISLPNLPNAKHIPTPKTHSSAINTTTH